MKEIDKRESSEKLQVALTNEELIRLGEEQTNALLDIEALEDDLKNYKASNKSKKQVIEARLKELSRQISSKSDYREVKVEIIKNYKEGVVRKIRLDTMKCYDERPMSDRERQLALEVEQAEKDAKKVDNVTVVQAGNKGEGDLVGGDKVTKKKGKDKE